MALFEAKAGVLPALESRWTHLPCQWPAPLVDVDQSQHGKGAVGILDQAPIACLGKAPQRFERPEHVLDLGANRRLALVGQLVRVAQRPVAVGSPVGEILGVRGDFLEHFLLVAVGAVTMRPGKSG